MSTTLATFALLGVLAAITPALGGALGLDIGVDTTTEMVDHVAPGIAVVLAAAVLQRGREGSAAAVAAAALGFLAGLMVLVSHVPLLTDAGTPPVSWGEAVFHSAAGLPLAGLGLFLFAGEVRRM